MGCVQLALDPIRAGRWSIESTRRALNGSGTTVYSGMMAMHGEDYATIDAIRATGGVRPAATWDANVKAAHDNAAVARELGIYLVTFHAGFIPEDESDPERETMIERVAAIARAFGDQGVRVALETGQESPAALAAVLADERLAEVGVNFDPANMVLYGSGDPIDALRVLAPRVSQIHLKDADPAPEPGVWGTEQPLGEGSVDWDAFFALVRERLPGVGLIVEREAGETRIEDVRTAVALARSHGVSA